MVVEAIGIAKGAHRVVLVMLRNGHLPRLGSIRWLNLIHTIISLNKLVEIVVGAQHDLPRLVEMWGKMPGFERFLIILNFHVFCLSEKRVLRQKRVRLDNGCTYILVEVQLLRDPVEGFPVEEHIPNLEDFDGLFLLLGQFLVSLPDARKKMSHFPLEVFYVVTLHIFYNSINTVNELVITAFSLHKKLEIS